MSIEGPEDLAGMERPGSDELIEAEDGWTVPTVDGSPGAHDEHALIMMRAAPRLLAG